MIIIEIAATVVLALAFNLDLDLDLDLNLALSWTFLIIDYVHLLILTTFTTTIHETMNPLGVVVYEMRQLF